MLYTFILINIIMTRTVTGDNNMAVVLLQYLYVYAQVGMLLIR